MFLITGCSSVSSVNLKFYGENENWRVTHEVKVDGLDSAGEKNLYIENKNNEKIDTINFELYRDSDVITKGTGIPLDNNKYISKSKNMEVASPSKESKYVIEIEWNGQKEIISLNNTN
jgi:hypothetical protein